MILLLDHDDSFVHTLAGYVARLGAQPVVRRVHQLELSDVVTMDPRAIILSPGPGAPESCALSLAVVRTLGETTPILGVCLGHQVIAHAYGATVSRAAQPRHGMTSPVSHDGKGVFAGLPSPFEATRYHSLAMTKGSTPDVLEISAMADDDGEVMGVRHRHYRVEGVQFHPESVLTEQGLALLRNFLAF